MFTKTYQQQAKDATVVPDKKFGAFIMQGFYHKVKKLNSKGKVVQAYADLLQVLNDEKDGKTVLEFLGITDCGPDDAWILNKDIMDPDQSITEKQAQQMVVKMTKIFKQNPKEMHLGLFFIAGHGMIHEGTQRLLLNEFDKQRKFYKFFPIEINIRNMTKFQKNSYLIVVMACCREIYSPKRHGNCVGASTQAEAEQQFDQIKAEQEKAKQDQQTNEEIIADLK